MTRRGTRNVPVVYVIRRQLTYPLMYHLFSYLLTSSYTCLLRNSSVSLLIYFITFTLTHVLTHLPSYYPGTH